MCLNCQALSDAGLGIIFVSSLGGALLRVQECQIGIPLPGGFILFHVRFPLTAPLTSMQCTLRLNNAPQMHETNILYADIFLISSFTDKHKYVYPNILISIRALAAVR